MPILHRSAAAALLALSSPAFALNILVSNDDGLTSNLKALYEALKAAGHDVIVSVPCSGQSGRGAGLVMYSTETIVAANDQAQIAAENGCHNGAAPRGAPAVGPFTKAGFSNGDWHYVHGTPVMAVMYGLDVLAPARWKTMPDLVLSGPNEGQNVGRLINSSGTVGNAQFAAARGIPAMALSAGNDTVDNATLADPESAIVAQLSVKLLRELARKAGRQPLLPPGMALNVNFPDAPKADTPFAFSRHGTYETYTLRFHNAVPYGFSIARNSVPPNAAQTEDESAVIAGRTAVTVMQVGFEQGPDGQRWLRERLRGLFRR